MSDEKFVLPDNGSFTIKNSAADSLISRGDGNAALVYVYILRNNGQFSETEAAKALNLSHTEILRVMGLLSQLGLVSGEFSKFTPPQAEECGLPQYSISDIQAEIKSSSDFSLLIAEMQRRLGRIFSAADLTSLFGIYDYLELPPQVILLLLTHCVDECHEKYGSGRLPTMRRIEKTAFAWSRMGLKDLESAEEYLKNIELKKSASAEIKTVLQIQGRNLTASEQKYVNSWLEMGFSPASLEIAYDRTVSQTGKLAWPYMNSIVKSWHSKGLHTPEEIQAGDSRKLKRDYTPAVPIAESSYEPENLERMKKMLEKLKND